MDTAVAIEKNDDAAEGPWALPNGWAWVKIESVLTPMEDGRIIHHGWSPQCEAFPSETAENWAVLKTTAVQPGAFLAHENKILPSHLTARANLEVHAGDLLLTCAGPRSRCGVACLVRETRPRLIFSGKMYRFRSDPMVMEASFLEAFLQTFHGWRTIDAMKTGGSDSGLNLTHDRFRQLLVPVAPIFEQRRIVARIDALFAEVAEGEAALAAARRGLDTFRHALLKAAVTGELTKDWRADNPVAETGHDVLSRIAKHRADDGAQKGRRRSISTKPLDNSALPELPEGWAWAGLGEVGEIVGGATVDKKRKPIDPVTVPYLRVANVQRGHVDLSKVKSITVERASAEKLQLIAGDLLLNEGGDRDKIGRGWVWDGSIPDMIHQNHVFRVRLHSASLNPFFVSHYANEMGRRFFIEGGKQTTNLASISLSKISMLPVPVPPPSEAAEILRRVSDALAAAADVLAVFDAEAADAARLKQSILKAAFEGRLAAQDVTDESATALLVRLAAKKTAVRPDRGRARKSAA
jgi:type I restriction enzyme, S subunit